MFNQIGKNVRQMMSYAFLCMAYFMITTVETVFCKKKASPFLEKLYEMHFIHLAQ